jgi:acyl-CoA reductase-like NAD-dependent aldehyde dehydrogenase
MSDAVAAPSGDAGQRDASVAAPGQIDQGQDRGQSDGLPAAASDLQALLLAQRAAFAHAPFPAWTERAAHLQALRAMLQGHRAAIAAAIDADFGQRCAQEVDLSELFLTIDAIRAALRHGRRWMKPERRRVGLWMLPARAQVVPQPLGVIGIIGAWNYPITVTIGPLVAALAAGNRAMLKMSEFTPRTSALIATLIGRTFAQSHVTVVNGGPEVAAAFSALPFDHLVFTGSTRIGREVMRAAAANLTPVTLELGGKSPVIIGGSARFDEAVDSIIVGKALNAGQTCIAPDYVLVPRGREQAFVDSARRAFAKRYPDLAHNRDYTAIISAPQFARLARLAADAVAAGARLHPLADTASDAVSRRFTPAVITGVTSGMAVMQDEIFGPLLPIVAYDSLDEAIAFVNARPRPLALYLYDTDKATIDAVLKRTVSGALSVNEALLHIAVDGLPFGGVGPSGMGAYHGLDGFRTLSRLKPVLLQSRLNGRMLVAPPYGRRFAAILKLMMKF